MLIKEICKNFAIQGTYLKCELIKNGHINSTYRVYYNNEGFDKSYIVQRINKYVFKKPEQVMANISGITQYTRTLLKEKYGCCDGMCLHFKRTIKDNKYYLIDEMGEYWRCYRFVDNSITYNETTDLDIICESGKAFGFFQNLLAEYNADSLYITIPNFHNTIDRYSKFEHSIKKNKYNRVKDVEELIDGLISYKDTACIMCKMLNNNELPLRVTHNDTKCNNVLFHEMTKKALCVIDLDTVMPGLVGFDFGDAIRFTCNNAKEDETDLSKVYVNLDKYEAFTKGFVPIVKERLTENEIETLVLGCITMAFELSVRFLTDYLNGDEYFKIDYPDHNVDRALCQYKLALDMISKRDVMEDIIRKYA